MFTITKAFAFSASHQLDGLPAEHQCARLHGHNYEVELELCAAELPPGPGFVHDYGALAPFRQLLDAELDHRHLNDLALGIGNPTAERLARWLYSQAAIVLAPLPEGVRVSAVRVRETPKTCAEYRP